MPFYRKDKFAEEKNAEMKEKLEKEKFEEGYIRILIANQKGKLTISSKYYKGNIAEGNWSIIEDINIEKLDEEIIDGKEIILGETEYRTKDAEYAYVFLPSYYAVISLITYYLNNKKEAEKIYGLKNAVIRRDIKKSEKFYGGLPFVIKYMKKLTKDDYIRFDFSKIMEELIDRKVWLEINKEKDNFINDIIDCIGKSYCKDFILKKRIKDFKDTKDEYFCIDFNDEIKEDRSVFKDTIIDGYRILMHRDVKKDWKHLRKEQIEEVNEKIRKTPKHPNNDSVKDSEKLKADLKGWYSQGVGKKDRLVYKKEKKEKIVYIATVCDHYKDATRRIKTKIAYK